MPTDPQMGYISRDLAASKAIEALGREAIYELFRAKEKHAAMHSAHEGWAVIWEELDELWDEVRTQKPDRAKMRKEAMQVAAMALRFIADVCDRD